MSCIINASTTAGLVNQADTSGVLALQTGGTTAVTVDASQKVGVGTNSPLQRFDVTDASTATRIAVKNTANAAAGSGIQFLVYNGATTVSDNTIRTDNSNNLQFYTSALGMALSSAGNLQFNSGYGSVATAYGCRAWVNFNGSGTVAIRASGNVSSVTDNGQGNYLVNFATVMPDTSYSVSYTASDRPGVDYGGFASTQQSGFTNSYIGLITGTPYALGTYDPVICSVAVFR